MAEAQGVPELVGGRLEQVGPGEGLAGPDLLVVKVGVPAEDGEEGVGEGAALAVERVAIPMVLVLEPDVNVNPAAGLLGEGEVGVLGPDVQSLLYLLVHGPPAEPPGGGVVADLVGQVLDTPPAS